MSDEPHLVRMSKELRHAFQSGKDREMLHILKDKKMLEDLIHTLQHASERTLTFSAPFISDLANRLGWLDKEEKRHIQ